MNKIFSLILAIFVLTLAAFPAIGEAANGLFISQTSVNLQTGQSTTLNVTVPFGETANVLGNTNTSVATAYITGNFLFISALNNGSTTIRVCTNSLNCVSVFVTVSGSGSGGQISFSPSSVSLNVGESRVATVFNSTGNSLFVSNNSNSNVASVSLSFNSITVQGLNNGSTTITICANSNFNNQCGSLFVTVSGFGGGGDLTFSNSNPFLNISETRTISVFNTQSNSLFISSNSNPNVVFASVSFNTVNLFGQNSGTATVRICENNLSRCGNIFVTVGTGGGGNQVVISQDSVVLNVNQNINLNIFGAFGSFFISNNSNSNVADASISGNNLWIFGRQSGVTTIRVCALNNSSFCDTVLVTVGSGSTNQIVFETNNVNLTVGATKTIKVFDTQNSNQSLFVSNNSNTNVVDVSAGADYVNLFAKQNGSANIIICRSSTSYCGILAVTVGGIISGNLIYQNGTLVNDNGTIYITYKNSKSGFANLPAFTGLGFKLSSVISGSTSSLTNTGYVISNPNIAHPWGSWLKSGQTVYFVHESGLIPIPSFDVFLNNGGTSRLVVDANFRDFAIKSILPVMSPDDQRLK
ncbi:MAG: Ig-like domain-containing protein [Candidatus Doudnabacteria bacterium]|nr:Ig-like domain-containing protein [Candidatus Doudnabacteria bacterium]